MEATQLVAMMVFFHICETVFGSGLPMGIGQRLKIHNRPCEAHVLRVRIFLSFTNYKQV